MTELTEAVNEVEHQYGSVFNAPDDVIKRLNRLANKIAPDNDGLGGNSILSIQHTKGYRQMFDRKMAALDTANMTAHEIADFINMDDEISINGNHFMSDPAVRNMLNYHHIEYKHVQFHKSKAVEA